MIKINLDKPFNLENTVTCGQIFRFYKQEDDSFDIILDDRVINVYVKNNVLYVTSNNEINLENKIKYYFDLETDYDSIDDYLIANDKLIESAVIFSKGLTMINQSPFETIIEYIISANNSVPSIANAINNISEKYGERVEFNNKQYYLFPTPEKLKNLTITDFRNCKVGFRDKYLYEIIQKINNNEFDINIINNLNTDAALEYLIKNKGIGPKVASCILLFSYKKHDVFPVDTWVKKIMKERYNIEGEQNIRNFAKETYGKYCGIAIQYLFNESRNRIN